MPTEEEIVRPILFATHGTAVGEDLALRLAHHIAVSDPENARLFQKGRLKLQGKKMVTSGCPEFRDPSPRPRTEAEWMQTPLKVGVYYDLTVDTLRELDAPHSPCRDYKMVHIVKDPVEMVADGYSNVVNSQSKKN